MQKRRVFNSNKTKKQKKNRNKNAKEELITIRSACSYPNKIKLIKPRVKFTDGSVVDLQSLIFRFNSSLTLT
jgi:hypothetical protein